MLFFHATDVSEIFLQSVDRCHGPVSRIYNLIPRSLFALASTKTHYASLGDHAARFLLGNQDRIPPPATLRVYLGLLSRASLVSASSLLAARNAIIHLSLVIPPTFDQHNRINVAFRIRTDRSTPWNARPSTLPEWLMTIRMMVVYEIWEDRWKAFKRYWIYGVNRFFW